MSIERLGPLDPTSSYNKNQKPAKIDSNEKDLILLSDEAKKKVEISKALNYANSVADIREDRIGEVRDKLKSLSNVDDVVINTIAEKILTSFGL